MGRASRDRIVATLANNRVMLADHINGQVVSDDSTDRYGAGLMF
jgi:hypothetical protein